MRSNIEGARQRRTVQEDAEGGLVEYLTTGAGPITINQNHAPVLSFDPGVAAVNVNMYVPSPPNLSVQYTIINRAAATGTLVVKQADGATTAGTIAVGKMGLAVWNGNPTSPTTSGWVVTSLP